MGCFIREFLKRGKPSKYPKNTEKKDFIDFVAEYSGVRIRPSKIANSYHIFLKRLIEDSGRISTDEIVRVALEIAEEHPEYVMKPVYYDDEVLIRSYKRLMVSALDFPEMECVRNPEKICVYNRFRNTERFREYQMEWPAKMRDPAKSLIKLREFLISASVEENDTVSDGMIFKKYRENPVQYVGLWRKARLATPQFIGEKRDDIVEETWRRILRTPIPQIEILYSQLLVDTFAEEFGFGQIEIENIQRG